MDSFKDKLNKLREQAQKDYEKLCEDDLQRELQRLKKGFEAMAEKDAKYGRTHMLINIKSITYKNVLLDMFQQYLDKKYGQGVFLISFSRDKDYFSIPI
jgi:hypothetical protein